MFPRSDNFPDGPAALKQLLAQMQSKVVLLEEENALLRQRLFGRKSEQTANPAKPQLPLFNEAESIDTLAPVAADEEVVAPTRRRGKRKPLPADLPRIEVIHELPEHELTCVCSCRRHAIGEETRIPALRSRSMLYSLLIRFSSMSARPVLPLGCTF